MFTDKETYAATVAERLKQTLRARVDREVDEYTTTQLWASLIERCWADLDRRHAWASVLDFEPIGELS